MRERGRRGLFLSRSCGEGGDRKQGGATGGLAKTRLSSNGVSNSVARKSNIIG